MTRYENWSTLKLLDEVVSIGVKLVCLKAYKTFIAGNILTACGEVIGNCICRSEYGNIHEMHTYELALLPLEDTEPAPKQERKIVQILKDEKGIVALCDDGSMWWIHRLDGSWTKLPGIPHN